MKKNLMNIVFCLFVFFSRRVNMSVAQLSMNENIGMHPMQYNPPETMNPMRTNLGSTNLIQPNNCDASTSIFNQNLYTGQSSGTSTTTTTTVQNPFDCDINTINSNLRSIRNPLSTFTPAYQAQNSFMNANAVQAYANALINPIHQPAHSTQTTQQQTIQTYNQTYNQTTSFFQPIQTNFINAAYFNTNDQSHQNHLFGQ